MSKKYLQFATVGASALILLGLSAESASTEIYVDSASCTGINCSSLVLPATIFSFGPSAGNWVINAFAAPGDCVRFDIPVEFTDLEIVVVAPNGTIYRNDNGRVCTSPAGSSACPLVKIGAAPNNGWYTVHVSRHDGAPAEGNFTLYYGRYDNGNPNCANPTSSSSVMGTMEEDATKGPDQHGGDNEVILPKPGEPGYRE